MTQEDNHNHFCIYCGAPLILNQHYCSQCGKEVFNYVEKDAVQIPSPYEEKIEKLCKEYNSKQLKASELVNKLFDPTQMSYQRFTAAIEKSNGLFDNQVAVARKMIEMDNGENQIVRKELENKILTLNSFINKMDELITEMVIHLSSNEKDNDDINNLFSDMNDLIDSVKDY